MGTTVRLIVQPGQQFDRLTVIDPDTRKGNVRAALCSCSCGTHSILVPIKHLVKGRVRSCGCIRREQLASRNRASASRGGLTRHPLYSTWAGMINRCYSPAAGNYRWYGGRGIRVWEPWINNPGLFIDWIEQNLGCRPSSHHSIERVDNDGDYEPGNLDWATPPEQARNRRPRTRKMPTA
jgi:hypothetical protein